VDGDAGQDTGELAERPVVGVPPGGVDEGGEGRVAQGDAGDRGVVEVTEDAAHVVGAFDGELFAVDGLATVGDGLEGGELGAGEAHAAPPKSTGPMRTLT